MPDNEEKKTKVKKEKNSRSLIEIKRGKRKEESIFLVFYGIFFSFDNLSLFIHPT